MLHPFYPIVPDIAWLERIVPLGVKTVQLRIKNRPRNDVRTQIEKCLQICARHDCQLIVNDYWRDAIELGATYIHLGQEDLAAADLPAIKKAGLKIGLSSHSHDELETALRADPDYIALGPIYETKLKKMKWRPQGLSRLAEWVTLAGRPVVAIGGITVERAPAVFNAGATSIAVVTDIVAHNTPETRVKEWLALSEGPFSSA